MMNSKKKPITPITLCLESPQLNILLITGSPFCITAGNNYTLFPRYLRKVYKIMQEQHKYTENVTLGKRELNNQPLGLPPPLLINSLNNSRISCILAIE